MKKAKTKVMKTLYFRIGDFEYLKDYYQEAYGLPPSAVIRHLVSTHVDTLRLREAATVDSLTQEIKNGSGSPTD